MAGDGRAHSRVGIGAVRRRMAAEDEPLPDLPRRPRWTSAPAALGGPIAGTLIACLIVVPSLLVSYGDELENFSLTIAGVPVIPAIHIRHNIVTDWAEWNYTGYQGKSGWPEFSGLMTTMSDLGERYGCGRAMWEYNSITRPVRDARVADGPADVDRRLHRLDGRLAVRVGVDDAVPLLEPGGAVRRPSEAMAEPTAWSTAGLDVQLGIQHLQLLGVKYFMASSRSGGTGGERRSRSSSASPRVVLGTPLYQGSYIDTTWDIYLVRDSQIVTPLDEPARGADRRRATRSRSGFRSSTKWYADPSDLVDPDDRRGPDASWTKVTASVSDPPKKAASAGAGDRHDPVRRGGHRSAST